MSNLMLPKPHMWCVDGMWACTHSRSPIFGTTYWRKSPQEAYVAWLDSVPWAARKSLLSQWRNELKGLA